MNKTQREIYYKGYNDAVKACACFLIDAHDLPSVAVDMKEWVLPNRNWRKRFLDATGMILKRQKMRE